MTRALDIGGAEIWIPGRLIVPDFQSTFVFFGERLLERQRDVGQRFLRGVSAGVERYIDEAKSPRLGRVTGAAHPPRPGPHPSHVLAADGPRRRIDLGQPRALPGVGDEKGLIDSTLDVVKMIDTGFLALGAERAVRRMRAGDRPMSCERTATKRSILAALVGGRRLDPVVDHGRGTPSARVPPSPSSRRGRARPPPRLRPAPSRDRVPPPPPRPAVPRTPMPPTPPSRTRLVRQRHRHRGAHHPGPHRRPGQRQRARGRGAPVRRPHYRLGRCARCRGSPPCASRVAWWPM